jgi:CRISPR/Cas system endoribonuclease Cas6 (RAMP superfamily)
MKIDPSSPALPIQYNYLVQSAIYAALPLSLVNNLLTKNRIRLGNSVLEVNEVRFDEQKVQGDVLIARTLSPTFLRECG